MTATVELHEFFPEASAPLGCIVLSESDFDFAVCILLNLSSLHGCTVVSVLDN